ncbi:MAG TPA: alpha-amylase family glycosyl hydrolase [Thermoanaerobaculia bacterium]|nr:alpha-amylase family glycosyl hydrolase [Thermoanaerobaculia bacterium]
MRLALLAVPLALAGCSGSSQLRSAPPPPPLPAAMAPAPARKAVVPQESWRDAILYFVIIDRFADGDANNDQGVDRNAKGTFHGGDLAGLRQQLDEIADLGATAIWITPVVKQIDGFVTGAGFPDWGYHGYWADDFYRLDPRFGTEAELKALVDDAHARGIKVLLDVVYNHAGYDSNLTKDPKTRGWFRTESAGTCGKDDLTLCVSGLPDFKTELPEVDDYLMTAHLGLAKRVGIDGFRLDTVKHVDHPVWQEHRRRTREQLGKDFFLIGEVWGGDAQSLDPWFSGDEMDAGFDFSFQGNVLGWVQGRGRTIAFDRYLKSREKVRAGHLLSPYLSSHDVQGALSLLGGDKSLFRLAALLELTASGIPMIYYGEEVGRAGGDWPDNRSDMPWGDRRILPGAGQPRDEALRADYKKLIALRRAHPAFARGTHSSLATDGDLLVFLQSEEGSDPRRDAVVVAINRGAAPATASFDAPPAWGDRPVRDVWSGEAVSRTSGGRIEAPVAPHGARIFAVEPYH